MTFSILILALLALAALIVLGAYICAQMVFAVHSVGEDVPRFPKGKQYLALKKEILELIDKAAALPYEDVWQDSDGLRLHGKLYMQDKNAPVHILFHGYRSSALLDFGGGLKDIVDRGHNALLVDQRAHAKSQGKYLSFGIKESRDCLRWIEYIIRELGSDTKIILEGVSMGGATVLMASGLELPDNVIGVLSDSAYSSPEMIIRHVMKKQHYPQFIFPLIRLGGIIFGRFDICSESPLKAMENCKVPVFFIHGDDDRFVPYEMSLDTHAACRTEKFFFTGKKAGHALSYLVDLEGYRKEHTKFMSCILK